MTEDLAAVLHADFFVELIDASQPPELEDIERLDRLLEGLDLFPLGDDWRAIDLEQARLLLDDVLGTDLGAGQRVRHALSPERILELFLGHFRLDQARFYTNVKTWNQDDAASWTPFTRGGLCVCVACCDSLQVGLLWTDQ